MINAADITAELNHARDDEKDAELEIQRLVTCYQHASPADRRVIWAVLNKYALYVDLQPRGAF